MSWSNSDLNCKLLLNKPVTINNIGSLKALTLNEITDMGFDVYNKYLCMLCVNSEDIHEMLNIPLVDENNVPYELIQPFDFIWENCKYNEEFKSSIVTALECFLHDRVVVNEEALCFDVGLEGLIHKDTYNFFIEIIKEMNCIQVKDKYTPTTLAEQGYVNELKEKKARYQNKKPESNINEVISAVCAKHPSINVLNVGELTIYQLFNQFQRLNAIDQYDININSMMHGAESKDITLTHWSEKIGNT